MARPTKGNQPRRVDRKGAYVDERVAWVNTAIGQMVYMHYPEVPEQKEPGPTVKVLLPQQGARTVMLDFTHLTGEELDAVKQFFEMVFQAAEPIVRARDKVAEDAFAAGDDSFSRSYRQVPQFIVRQRKDAEHGEGVQHGSSDVPSGELPGSDSDAGGVRGAGSDVAHVDEAEGFAEDNGPTPD